MDAYLKLFAAVFAWVYALGKAASCVYAKMSQSRENENEQISHLMNRYEFILLNNNFFGNELCEFVCASCCAGQPFRGNNLENNKWQF